MGLSKSTFSRSIGRFEWLACSYQKSQNSGNENVLFEGSFFSFRHGWRFSLCSSSMKNKRSAAERALSEPFNWS